MRRALVAALLLAGVTWPAEAAVVPGVVEVRNNFFDPQTVRVAAGSTVRWTVVDGGHTVTADDGRFDWGPLREGETVTWTAGADETVRYHCRLHSGEGMVGSIVVGNGGAAPPVDTAPVLLVPSAAYPTIGAAVASAAPGSVVRVAAGVYDEAVEVTTPRLTIEAVGDVVLDGGYRREVGIRGAAEGLLVQGVAVRRYLTAGLEVGAGGMAQRVSAYENPVGVKAVGAGYVVRDSALEGNGVGIHAAGAGDVIGNTVAVGRVGVWVDGAAGVRVAGNRVEGGRMGIVVSGPSRSVSVVDNVVGGSTQADVAYDGLGVDVCFSANRRADGGVPTTEPVVLPSCEGPVVVGVPDPLVHVWLRA